MVIEVFKTNLEDEKAAGELVQLLRYHLPGSRINVDMHDCDKILRIQGDTVNINEVISIAGSNGVNCIVLE